MPDTAEPLRADQAVPPPATSNARVQPASPRARNLRSLAARAATLPGQIADALPLPRLDDRVGRAALSVMLAALLWYYVVSLENPTLTTVYTNLPVEIRGVGANLKVINPPGPVKSTIQAPENVLGTLRQVDVRPYVDLADLGAGVHTLPVRADVGGLESRGGDVSFEPDRVLIQVEELASRELPLEVRVTGTPSFGHSAEPAQPATPSVRVRGITGDVGRVARVVVTVNIDEKASTQQGSLTPVALDAEGRMVENVSFDPESVEVVVPIKLEFNYRAIPVRVPVVGQPAPGYRVSAITVDPTNATVCCSPELLEPLEFLDTLPIGITGTTSSVVTTTRLLLPAGVELYPGQPKEVSVTVSVEALVTTLQVSVSPVVEGQPEGADVVVSPNRLELTLSGTFAQLQDLKPTDVRAFVNVGNRGPGTYELKPQIIVPQGVRLESSTPEVITITLIAPTPEPTPSRVPATPTLPADPTASPTRAEATGTSTPTEAPEVTATATATVTLTLTP